MEFLYKLYSNNYFGLGLFIVITVLAFSFLIILFFGKKDEKARENAKNNQMVDKVEQNAEMLNALEQKESPATLENNELKEPELEEISLEPTTLKEEEIAPISIAEDLGLDTKDIEEYVPDSPVTENERGPEEEIEEYEPYPQNTAKTSYQEEYDIKEEVPSIIERTIAEEPVYDTSIYEQPVENEESIEDVLNKYDIIEDNMNNDSESNINAPEPDSDLHIFPSASDLGKEEMAKKPASTPFSSVYLSKEEPKEKEEESFRRPTPTRPQFELPKMADLPKRNTNVQTTHENIINTTPTQNKEEKNNIFRDIEEDSYWVNK